MSRDRRTYLGSTDIGAILGLSPWTTAWQVWDSKMRGEPEPPAGVWWRRAPTWYGSGHAISEASWWGQASERANVRAYWLSTGCVRTLRDIPDARPHPDNPRLASSPDALVDDDGALECKEVNDFQWRETWDEGRTVPEWVRLQCLWHLACTGRDWCDISVRVVGRGGGLQAPIRVERDEAALAQLIAIGDAWWQRHIVGGEEPVAGAHDLDRLRLRAPKGPDPIPWAAPPELRAALDTLRRDMALLKDLEGDVDRQRAELMQHLVSVGSTDAYFAGDERPAFRLLTTERATPDIGGIRAAHKALHPGPRSKPKTIELPEGITGEQIDAAIAVLDAFATTTTSTSLRLGKE